MQNIYCSSTNIYHHQLSTTEIENLCSELQIQTTNIETLLNNLKLCLHHCSGFRKENKITQKKIDDLAMQINSCIQNYYSIITQLQHCDSKTSLHCNIELNLAKFDNYLHNFQDMMAEHAKLKNIKYQMNFTRK